MEAIEIVRRLYAAQGARDVDSLVDGCADDISFNWVADPKLSKYAGSGKGKDAFLLQLATLGADFEYRDMKPYDFIASGDRVAVRTELHMTRRSTGREFIIHCADFWTIRGGKVVEFVEYYDTALANAVLG
jgi:uncharacterized protein